MIGCVKFEDTVREIFAVSALPGVLWLDLVSHDVDVFAGAFVLPDEALEQALAYARQQRAGVPADPG